MKKIGFLLILCTLFSGCIRNHTDKLETHQIASAPKIRWVHWENEEPIDVTEKMVKTNRHCPHQYLDGPT